MFEITGKVVLKDIYCNRCSLQFHSKSVFSVHLSLVHKEKNESKKQSTLFINDAKTKKVSFKYENFYSGFSSKQVMDPSNHEKNETFKCNTFQLNTSQKNDLKKHKQKQSIECDSEYKSKEGLDHHRLSVHERKKSLQCSICDTGFLEKRNLYNHMAAIHEGKGGLYQCPHCSKGFTRKDRLKFHITAVHEGKIPLKCGICNAGYKSKEGLDHHRLSVHERKKSLPCPICEKFFVVKLNRHIENVHGRKKRSHGKKIASIQDRK